MTWVNHRLLFGPTVNVEIETLNVLAGNGNSVTDPVGVIWPMADGVPAPVAAALTVSVNQRFPSGPAVNAEAAV